MRFTKPLLKTKLKATAVHLCMSIVVFAYLAYQIYFNWYPEPYFSVDGGWQGIRLVSAVDLVLGPFITFLIFDLRKSRREILFDLITIVTIQFGALGYGIYSTYTQRPVAIVVINEFVVSATMEQYGGTLNSADDLQKYSDEKPPVIYADFPTSRQGMDEVQRRKIENHVLEHAQMQLYRHRPELAAALKKRQVRVLDLLERSGPKQAYSDWLQQNGKDADSVLLEHFSGRYGYAWLVFDLDGKYLGYFGVD
jgi:hypothetical protein